MANKKLLIVDETILQKFHLLNIKDRNKLENMEITPSMLTVLEDSDYVPKLNGQDYLDAVQQALSGAGAANITSFYTAWTTTGADALTLADGTFVGQLKKIQLIVDGGSNGTLTPANLADGTTIVFADAGDFCFLRWNGTNWRVLELGNDADGATAPVLS